MNVSCFYNLHEFKWNACDYCISWTLSEVCVQNVWKVDASGWNPVRSLAILVGNSFPADKLKSHLNSTQPNVSRKVLSSLTLKSGQGISQLTLSRPYRNFQGWNTVEIYNRQKLLSVKVHVYKLFVLWLIPSHMEPPTTLNVCSTKLHTN